MSSLDYRDFAALLGTYLLFGRYPSQTEVEYLENEGVTLFVDVTSEKLPPYTPVRARKIRYPIKDRNAPECMETFSLLVHEVAEEIENGAIVYVHCRGGHGRSATLAACLYMLCRDYNADKAIRAVWHAHQKRREMDKRWKVMGAPQMKCQRDLIELFEEYTREREIPVLKTDMRKEYI